MSMHSTKTGSAHDTNPSAGILLVNLGSPDDPSPRAVRRYLAEFLSDPRVIETPAYLWQPLLHGIILRIRPRKTALKYREIWTENGSPFLVTSRRQAAAITHKLSNTIKGPVYLELAMRYGNPSVSAALEGLRRRNMRRLLVLPLYPQYSATTTASSFDAVMQELGTWRWLPELRFVNHYHDDPGYIDALATSIIRHREQQHGTGKLLFSFHGLPKRYFLLGDPYFCECHKTARLVAGKTGLAESDWTVSFQSRFGPAEWLQPYTDDILREWAAGGVKNVAVICPGFAADCLETLEEINIRSRKVFLSAGGGRFSYIPALNDELAHINLLTDLIIRHAGDWPEFSANRDMVSL